MTLFVGLSVIVNGKLSTLSTTYPVLPSAGYVFITSPYGAFKFFVFVLSITLS